MEDVQAKSTSTLTVTALQYGAQVPDTLLQPRGLPAAATSPLWNGLAACQVIQGAHAHTPRP
jgi:hypothetical protein